MNLVRATPLTQVKSGFLSVLFSVISSYCSLHILFVRFFCIHEKQIFFRFMKKNQCAILFLEKNSCWGRGRFT